MTSGPQDEPPQVRTVVRRVGEFLSELEGRIEDQELRLRIHAHRSVLRRLLVHLEDQDDDRDDDRDDER